jgi:hypothetical protein
MDQELPHPSFVDLRLDEVADGRWRVTDRRFRATNPRTLLGFIQQRGERFEVTDVRRSSEPALYGSHGAAVAAFLPMTSAPRSTVSSLAHDSRF